MSEKGLKISVQEFQLFTLFCILKDIVAITPFPNSLNKGISLFQSITTF